MIQYIIILSYYLAPVVSMVSVAIVSIMSCADLSLMSTTNDIFRFPLATCNNIYVIQDGKDHMIPYLIFSRNVIAMVNRIITIATSKYFII